MKKRKSVQSSQRSNARLRRNEMSSGFKFFELGDNAHRILLNRFLAMLRTLLIRRELMWIPLEIDEVKKRNCRIWAMACDAPLNSSELGWIAKSRSKSSSPKSLRKSLKNRSVARTAIVAASKLNARECQLESLPFVVRLVVLTVDRNGANRSEWPCLYWFHQPQAGAMKCPWPIHANISRRVWVWRLAHHLRCVDWQRNRWLEDPVRWFQAEYYSCIHSTLTDIYSTSPFAEYSSNVQKWRSDNDSDPNECFSYAFDRFLHTSVAGASRLIHSCDWANVFADS